MFRARIETDCHRTRRLLSEYLDRRLSDVERLAVQRHLDTCQTCSRELASLRITVQLLHEVPAVPVPRSFAVRRQEVERVTAPAPQRLRWLRPATAVAVVVLALVVAVDLVQLVPGQFASERGGGLATPSTQAMLSPARSSLTVPAGYSQSIVPGVAVTSAGSFYVYDESQVPSNVRVKPSGEIRLLTADGAVDTGISVTGEVIDSNRARAGGYLPPGAAKAEETPGASPFSSPTPLTGLFSSPAVGNVSGAEPAGNLSREGALNGGSRGGTTAGWPARQIEIGVGAVALGLMGATVYTTWRGRGRAGVK